MSTPLDLSVSILSYNTKDITDQCLKTLQSAIIRCQKELDNKVEVIVLDNASTDGSAEMISKKHSWVRLIRSNINTGFGKGHNIVMQSSKSPHILLLNSDAFVEEDTLLKALTFLKENPEVDCLGCKLKYADGKFQPSAGFLPNTLNTFFWISGLALLPFFDKFAKPIHPKDKDFFRKKRRVDWLMGSFLLFKREVFEKTKGFDEKIFMYGEDIELGMRMKRAGFQLWYNPEFTITHLERASSKFDMQKPLLNEIKALVYYYNKFYPGVYPIMKFILAFFLLLRALAFMILGKDQRRKAYIEALKVL